MLVGTMAHGKIDADYIDDLISDPNSNRVSDSEKNSIDELKKLLKEELEDEEVSIWGVPLLKGDRTDVILLKFVRARELKTLSDGGRTSTSTPFWMKIWVTTWRRWCSCTDTAEMAIPSVTTSTASSRTRTSTTRPCPLRIIKKSFSDGVFSCWSAVFGTSRIMKKKLQCFTKRTLGFKRFTK
ncbi:Patellin-3 [Glycine soja]